MIIEKLGDMKSIKFSNFLERIFEIEKKPGIYIIRYLENGVPKHFVRLDGTDKEGILCIGKSKDIRRRITQFYDDINTKDLNIAYHSEGWICKNNLMMASISKDLINDFSASLNILDIPHLKTVWKNKNRKNLRYAIFFNKQNTMIFKEKIGFSNMRKMMPPARISEI